MRKVLLLVFVALLATTLIEAASTSCGRHGDPCVSSSNCCANMKCHRYANRCQVTITEEELMAQREKILGRKGKDY
ncbi:omega-conotoxin-like protein 1 [Calliopsis andreniformis]|uniref:omega-conotoxin-like protein 1 n=1 Tax=Calliopsis andreniformis TaxID=337506 RepID=UPI003FCCF5B0